MRRPVLWVLLIGAVALVRRRSRSAGRDDTWHQATNRPDLR